MTTERRIWMPAALKAHIARLERNPVLYGKDGCYVHPRCVECPLPECLYDLLDRGQLPEQDQFDAENGAVQAVREIMRQVQQRMEAAAAMGMGGKRP